MINCLTPEQETFIPIIKEQWISLATNTLAIDKQNAEQAIQNLYIDDNRKFPEIVWIDNPFDAYLFLGEKYGSSYHPWDPVTLLNENWNINNFVDSKLFNKLQNQINNGFYATFTTTIERYLFSLASECLLDEELYYLSDLFRTWKDRSLNIFHECTLLKIKSDPYGMFFLKVITLDRSKIHFCLLPSNITFVREAERWVKTKIYSQSELSYLCNEAS